MRATEAELTRIPGLIRYENVELPDLMARVRAAVRTTWTHEEVHGQFCNLQAWIDCPPLEVFEYLADIRSQEEFTYSVRDLVPVGDDGLHVGRDIVGSGTRIFVRVEANREAMTVDYHAAWDQSDELWMIYLFRVVPAELVLKRPGTVLLWTNCFHPYYAENPFPDLAPPGRPWIGELWPMFQAGHQIELDNLRVILEHRHGRGSRV